METISSSANPAELSPYSYSAALQSRYDQNALILDATFGYDDSETDDSTVVDINRLTQGLSLTADEILQKLNEQLRGSLPEGIESLKPEDYTPDRTATSVVDAITSLFAAYEKSNPELSPEDLITRFMKAARSGIEQGYSDAYETLDGLGAFQFDGVKSGVEETKTLIAAKLDAFESAKRKELGVEEQQTVAAATATAIKSQAGVNIAA